MSQLPIVKYEGLLWYFDERLNELRDYYTAEPRRLDSSGLEREYFSDLVIKGQTPIPIFDGDKTLEDDEHVPRVMRDLLPPNTFDEDSRTGDAELDK